MLKVLFLILLQLVINQWSSGIWSNISQSHNLAWIHFLFTWKDQKDNRAALDPTHGLRVYIDGELKLSTHLPEVIPTNNKNTVSLKDHGEQHHHRQIIDERDVRRITFGQVGPLREMKHAGKFEFGHLAIWRKALGKGEVESVFKVSVRHKSQNDVFCCERKKKLGMKNNSCSCNPINAIVDIITMWSFRTLVTPDTFFDIFV